MTDLVDALTTQDVCRELGITYRTLDNWLRHDVVKPMIRAKGSGTRRFFSISNRRILWALTEANRLGVTRVEDLKLIAEVVEPKSHGQSMKDQVLLFNGEKAWITERSIRIMQSCVAIPFEWVGIV